jgi:phospholipid/cholesterol/gamma-HCH transport system substrate-binding protein
MRQLGAELTKTAKQFREANLIGNINDRVTQLSKVLDDAHQAIAHINSVIGDEKLKQQIDESVANIHSATESVKSVTAKADKVADGLNGAVVTINKTAESTQVQIETISKSAQSRLEEASKLLTQVNEITAKVNEGQGTAGKMVNDPKLYEGLVETTAQLNTTIKDLQRLVQQWEQEGVSLKLR